MEKREHQAGPLRTDLALVAAVIALALSGRIAGAAQGIEPNPAIQTQIAAAAVAHSEVELQAALSKLQDIGGANHELLIPQLVFALMHSRDDRQAMIPGVLIERLGITKQQLHSALDPYRGTDDPRLKAQLDNLLNN